jgi:hypothetical protein
MFSGIITRNRLFEPLASANLRHLACGAQTIQSGS